MPVFLTSLIDTRLSLQRLREMDELPDANITVLTSWEEDSTTHLQPLPSLIVKSSDVPPRVDNSSYTPPAAPPTIECVDASFRWFRPGDRSSAAPTPVTATNATSSVVAVTIESNNSENSHPVAAAAVSGVTLRCRQRSLTVIIGPIGAGKSTLLAGLVGDAALCGGFARVRGSVAYCGQQPWLMNASIRDNITAFSSAAAADVRSHLLDEPLSYLSRVVASCGLTHDLSAMPRGLDTLVGDRGVALSGGQRARIALARAVFSRSDVVLLDDVFSAIDAHVAAHVWEHAIVGELLRSQGATVVLVTQSQRFAASACVSDVIVMREGRIVAAGPPADVLPQAAVLLAATGEGPALSSGDVATHDECDSPVVIVDTASPSSLLQHPYVGTLTDAPASTAAPPNADSDSGGAGPSPLSRPFSDGFNIDDTTAPVVVPPSPDASSAPTGAPETYEHGHVNARHMLSYVMSMGTPLLVVLIGLYVASQALTVASTYWLVVWTSSNSAGSSSSSSSNDYSSSRSSSDVEAALQRSSLLLVQAPPQSSAMWYAGGYGIITAALCGVSLLRMAVLNVGIFRASTRLHNDALTVLRAPMSFFDVNPAGRILNRFIGDVSTIDNTLRVSISAFATQVFNLVAVSVAIALSSPSVLALVAALGALYYVLGAAYRVGARDMRRMLSVAKSPMLSHFVEVQRGVAVIRAFGPCAAAAVIDTHIALCDDFTRATLAYWSANEFISTAFEVIGSSVILAVALSVVYQCGAGGLSAPTAGFALTYVLQLPPTLMWLVRQFCMLETDLVSVERLGEYAAVQSEDAAEMAVGRGTKVDAVEAAAQQQWGERRHHRQQHEQLQSLRCKREAASVSVSLQHVTLRYGGPGSPPALNDFNLEIPPGCKLALVGRTGASADEGEILPERDEDSKHQPFEC